MSTPPVSPVPAQVGGFLTTLALVALAIAAVSVVRGTEIVEEGEPRALLVMGEYRGVLEPGIVVYPPFVSRTYPVDTETLTVETSGEAIDVPERDHPSLRAHGIDPSDGDFEGEA